MYPVIIPAAQEEIEKTADGHISDGVERIELDAVPPRQFGV